MDNQESLSYSPIQIEKIALRNEKTLRDRIAFLIDAIYHAFFGSSSEDDDGDAYQS